MDRKLLSSFSILLCWIFVFPEAIVAQEPGGDLIQRTFRCLSWEAPIRETLFVKTEEGMFPLRIHNMRRSEEIDYVGSNPVVFYREAGQGPEGPRYEPVAQVDLQGAIQDPLLFFIGSSGGFRIIPMEDSFERYPLGSYRFYNFTDQKLITKFGEDTLTLPPKKTTVLESPFDENTQYPILIVVQDTGGLKPLYSNVWRHNENFRYMILVSKSGSKDLGAVEFRILSDFPENQTVN